MLCSRHLGLLAFVGWLRPHLFKYSIGSDHRRPDEEHREIKEDFQQPRKHGKEAVAGPLGLVNKTRVFLMEEL